jgi:hypothetical protein
MAQNDSTSKRTKHINIRYHFTKNAILEGEITLKYCSTTEMVPDMMTKALGKVKLDEFVTLTGLVRTIGWKDVTVCARGRVLKLVLNQMVLTCSNVTTIDVSDVQQMSQMADLNGSDSVSMSPPPPSSSRPLVSVFLCGILGL